ncbi:MAG: hypothetical protein QOK49_2929 [Baekduia sp.]|nr:hypothetical protein [Baekduia sp.]
MAVQRRVGEQVHAALDEVVAAARRRVGALGAVEVQPHRRRRDEHEQRTHDERCGADAEGPPRPPARAGQHEQAQQQRREARLRQRQHQAGHQDRQDEGRRPDLPRPPRPQEHAADPEHDQRQEAPVDVGVEEERVDPEVALELVGGDDLGVQEQVARVVLHEADRRERQRQRAQDAERLHRQPRCPRDARQQREQQRERHVEEDDVLQGLGEVAGVGRLQGVQHDRARHEPLEQGRPALGLLRLGATQARHRVGQRARPDDDVQRHEQVGRRAARGDRHAERDRRRRRQRERRRVAVEDDRERAERADPGHEGDDRHRGVVAQRTHLLGVPDVGDQQDGREDERAERRKRAQAGPRQEHGTGGEQGAEDQRERSVHIRAISALVAGSVLAATRCENDGNPGRMTRPLPNCAATMTDLP